MSLSFRKVTDADYPLLRNRLARHDRRIKRWNEKKWARYADLETSLNYIMSSDSAYIVGEQYLVVYHVDTPWYAKDEHKFLQELIVLRLVRGSGTLEDVVTFLRERAAEAGAVLLGVGTASARSDAALASIYESLGAKPETTILIMEPGSDPGER